jgi:hypothetical protein
VSEPRTPSARDVVERFLAAALDRSYRRDLSQQRPASPSPWRYQAKCWFRAKVG